MSSSEGVEELEDFLNQELFSGKPKSVGEAVAEVEAPPREPDPEEAPERVPDERPGIDRPDELLPPAPPEEDPARPDLEPEEGEEESPEDEGVVWAKRKYGEDVSLEKIAKAAYEQERHITQIAREKREAEELASQWYEYAQQVEQQSQAQLGAAMPLSAQEEQWIENSLTNPVEFARQAAHSGRVSLYTGVINRLAEENPGLAAQVGTQVQMEMQQLAQAQQQQAQPQASLADALGQSFNRLGLNLPQEGPRMAAKIGELGEYHPYVRAIMSDDDAQRDLAVQAVHDLVRATSFSPRQVQHNENLSKEQELRRDVASVQTGAVEPPAAPPKESILEQAMIEEWQRAGQWQTDE